MVVARRIDCLRQVNDHRTGRRQQHVELGQVTVHQTGTQHQHDLLDQERVILARLIRLQHHVVQTRGGIAIFVSHQLHEQHAFEEVERLGHTNASAGQTKQCRNFGVLPRVFGFLAPELRALGHRTGLPAVAYLATFLILGRLTETAFVSLLVNLGTPQLIATAHHINSCLFTTHERAQHLVDQTVFDQGFNAFRSFHQLLLRVLCCQIRDCCRYTAILPQRVGVGPCGLKGF